MLDLKLALSLFHTFFTYYFATLVLFFVLRNVGQLDINLIQQYHVRVVNTVVRIVQRLLDDLVRPIVRGLLNTVQRFCTYFTTFCL